MLLKLGLSDPRVVDYLFLSAFSRYPRDSERQRLVEDLDAAETKTAPGSVAEPRRAGLVDMAWAVLTSEEFMFNH